MDYSDNTQIRDREWPEENGNELNLMDLLHICLVNWKWFLLSFVLCTGLAYLYLLQAPRVYTRTASVMIKEENKNGNLANNFGFSTDLTSLGFKNNVDNEVLVFKTYRLMEKVAQRLHLDVSYTIKPQLRKIELYRQSPVSLSFPEAEPSQSFALKVTPLNENEVMLSDFVVIDENGEEQEISKQLKVALKDSISTPVGKVIVNPSFYYTNQYFNTPIQVRKSNLEGVTKSYLNNLQTSLASKTSTIINLTLQDVSIARAEDVLNTLIAVYNEAAIDDKNQITINTSEFIAERLVIIEKELGSVDADIEKFKQENRLTDITSESGMYLESTSRFQQEGVMVENQLTMAKYIREYLSDPNKASDLIPANTGISDANIEQQIAVYNETLLKRDRLISNSSNRNPVVMDLNNNLGAMKQTIIRAIDNLIVSLDIKSDNIRMQEEQITKRISAVPTQQKYVLSVERQQKIKEALYLFLLNKREENALTQAMTESNMRILDEATGSSEPVAPKSAMIMLAGLILGLAIPAGILWLRWANDTRIRSMKDVQEQTALPLLGEIPALEKNQEKLVVKEGSRDSVSEAFRILRANMDFMRGGDEHIQVLLFTSMNAGAGKTFVSSNLAASLVLTRQKVVLLDLDIRKGTLGKQTGYKGDGITNYLSGKVTDVSSLICHDELVPGLDVIYAGPVPPNPAELLQSKRLDVMIAELRSRYDFVVLDNVPAGLVADAQIVARLADLTLCIVRAGVLDRRQVPALEILSRRFPKFSLVLNCVKGYHQGYGYGYGYGYGNEKN